MECKDREGNVVFRDNGQDRLLKSLYESNLGRMALSVLVKPGISKLCGKFMDSGLSKFLIPGFIEKNNIDMSEYECSDYTKFKSFNDFFTRKIRYGMRQIDNLENVLISPSDGRISVYDIDEDSVFYIKNSRYTIESLTHSKSVAEHFKGGKCVIIRLCVDNYHRYCYIDDGFKSRNKFIPGVLHTVNPVANNFFNIYTENSRECTILYTENFGKVMQIEVGAMLVGKIKNHDSVSCIKKGMEKGYFEYGGSTIVLLFEENKVVIDEDLINNTRDGFETAVKMGEGIGYSKNI